MGRLLVVVLVAACSFHPAATPSETPPEAGGSAIDASTGDSRPPDAPRDAPPDAASACNTNDCTGINGTCQGDVCVVEVTTTGDLTCPAGLTCRFDCDNGIACKGNIDCKDAVACTIDCKVMNACDGARLDCSGNGCTVLCRDVNTCTNLQLECGTGADACVLECCPAMSCGGNIQTQSGTITQHSPGTCP